MGSKIDLDSDQKLQDDSQSLPELTLTPQIDGSPTLSQAREEPSFCWWHFPILTFAVVGPMCSA